MLISRERFFWRDVEAPPESFLKTLPKTVGSSVSGRPAGMFDEFGIFSETNIAGDLPSTPASSAGHISEIEYLSEL